MTVRQSHILVVEDDEVTRAKLAGYLEAVGHRVSEAADGEEMRAILSADPVDLVLLDINLPGEDGLDLTRQIRSRSEIGIILVTGRVDDIDRIVGLEIGADDYITKPFNSRELLARVKNLLRRTAGAWHAGTALRKFCGWELDLRTRRLRSPDQQRVSLTRAEFELLAAFVERPGAVLQRELLFNQITYRNWGPHNRTIDVLVRRLRQKLEEDPKDPEIIITAHGEGYIFAAELDEW